MALGMLGYMVCSLPSTARATQKKALPDCIFADSGGYASFVQIYPRYLFRVVLVRIVEIRWCNTLSYYSFNQSSNPHHN